MSALGECSLVCVDPKRVSEVWPHVKGLLEPAIDSEMPVAALLRGLLEARFLLWLVWDGEEINGAVVTELAETGSGRVCVIVAMGGKGRARWLHLISKIEEFASAEGCRAMRLYGRLGWKRVLPDYRQTRVILEKDLPHGR